ncbi:hypothetical protein [Kitasatospora sp. CB02891]|uniref:hypothetical protein n=1 Tax=Kitasatospora sp. CB02891 TaxID=2020329 RepID=UPI000C275CD7|nr:hypothetical protein [Kitasatospora sp. CB02891]PJN26178.1 hypothetical protein CG736_12395 [Kitasatospora sp. CB02891]
MEEPGTSDASTATDADSNGGGNDYRLDIDGDALGPVVVGDHNLVVDAQHGSTVTLLVAGHHPEPVRREQVAMLPRRQQDPIGRAAELADLERAIRAGGLVQLFGPSGTGTSMLLRHVAHRPAAAAGTDGRVYLNAADREIGDLAQEIFEACYDAVGYAPSEPELKRLMAEVRVTVYLDNADLTRHQARALADLAPGATFVLASHRPSLLEENAALVELAGLDRAAGLELLTRALRRPLAPDELAGATALWQAAQGRPLHLLQAAVLARFRSTADGGLPRAGEVSELIPLLLDGLDAPSTEVLRLLATLDGAELAPDRIGAIADLPDAAAVCERLAEVGLLRAEQHGYRCPPDAVAAALGRTAPFPFERICERLTDWVTRRDTAPAEVAEHSRALERAVVLAEAAGRPELAVHLARAASPAMARALRPGAWGRLLGRGWNAAERSGDRPAQTFFIHEEGIRSLLTGRRVVAAALLGEAALLWKAIGDLHGATAALNAQSVAPALGGQLPTGLIPAPSAGLGGAGAHGGAAVGGGAGTTPGAAAHGAQAHSVASHMANLAPTPPPPAAPAAVPHVGSVPHATAPAAQHGAAHAGRQTAGHAAAGHAAAGHAAAGASVAAGAGATGTAGLLGGKGLLVLLGVLLAGTGAITWSISGGGGSGSGSAGGGKELRAPFDQAVQALAAAPGVRYQGDWNVEEYLNDVTVTAHGEKVGTSHLVNQTMASDKNAQDLLSIGGKDYSRWHTSDGSLRLWTYDGLGDRNDDGSSRLTEELSLYKSPADLAKQFSQALADRPRLPSAQDPQTTNVGGVPALRADTTIGYLFVTRDAPYRVLRWELPNRMILHIDPKAPLPRALEARTHFPDITAMDLTLVAPGESGAMYDALEKSTKDLATATYGGLDFTGHGDGSSVNCDASGCHVKEVVTAEVLKGDAIVRRLSSVNVQLTVGSLSIDGRAAGSCTSGPQPLPVTGDTVNGTLTCDDPAGAAVYQQVSAANQDRANALGSSSYWDRAEDIEINSLVLTGAEVDSLLATVRQERSAAR